MDEHTCIGFVFYDNIIREPLIINLLRFDFFRRTAVNLQAIRGLVFLRHQGKAEFPGAEGGVPRCRAPCSPVPEKCPVQKAFGMGRGQNDIPA